MIYKADNMSEGKCGESHACLLMLVVASPDPSEAQSHRWCRGGEERRNVGKDLDKYSNTDQIHGRTLGNKKEAISEQ